MNLRKLDYIVFYLIAALILIINLIYPIKLEDVIGAILLPIIPALVLATITNFIFRGKNA